MAEAEMARLNEIFREHVRLESEISERFQALTRGNSIEEMQTRLHTIEREHSNQKQTLEGNLATLRAELQTAERENQRLKSENDTLHRRFEEEQERRRSSELDFRNTISGLEVNVQTLQRKNVTLETQLQEAANYQRQRAESDADRIRTLREEIAASRRELEREQIERRTDCQRLRNEVSARERTITEAEQEKARLRERIDTIEREHENRNQTIVQLRDEAANIRTERTRLEIQMADAEQQYTERITRAERESLRQEQELLGLRERLDTVMNIIQDYLRKNARTSVELSRLRERLDHVDREQTDNTELLERDLRRSNRRR